MIAKLDSREVKQEKEKIKILRDLVDLFAENDVSSLKSALMAHMDSVVVTEDNFSSLVGMADGTKLMQPLRMALAAYT